MRRPLATLACTALLAAGCGYSVGAGASRLPAGTGKVYVPSLENRTADAEAGALVAAALREELARRGASGGEGSSSRIQGEVTRSSTSPVTTQGGTWRLVLEVQASLVVDGAQGSRVKVRQEVDYLGEVDAIATEGRRRLALQRAASDAAREIVERLEGP